MLKTPCRMADIRTGMAKPYLMAGALLVFALSRTAAAQTLADIARAEEARRKTVKGSGKVYTNDTLRGPDGGAPPPPPAAPAPPNDDKPAAAAKPSGPAPADRSKDEKYWRDRIASARAELQRSQAFHEALQSQIQALYTEFVATDDPIQRAIVEKKRLAALAELDRVKSETARLTKQVAAVEDEARRANVPAGWLR